MVFSRSAEEERNDQRKQLDAYTWLQQMRQLDAASEDRRLRTVSSSFKKVLDGMTSELTDIQSQIEAHRPNTSRNQAAISQILQENRDMLRWLLENYKESQAGGLLDSFGSKMDEHVSLEALLRIAEQANILSQLRPGEVTCGDQAENLQGESECQKRFLRDRDGINADETGAAPEVRARGVNIAITAEDYYESNVSTHGGGSNVFRAHDLADDGKLEAGCSDSDETNSKPSREESTLDLKTSQTELESDTIPETLEWTCTSGKEFLVGDSSGQQTARPRVVLEEISKAQYGQFDIDANEATSKRLIKDAPADADVSHYYNLEYELQQQPEHLRQRGRVRSGHEYEYGISIGYDGDSESPKALHGRKTSQKQPHLRTEKTSNYFRGSQTSANNSDLSCAQSSLGVSEIVGVTQTARPTVPIDQCDSSSLLSFVIMAIFLLVAAVLVTATRHLEHFELMKAYLEEQGLI